MVEGTDFIEHIGGIDMGSKTGDKARYITRITDTELVKLVFTWLQTDDGKATLATPTIGNELVIGWWDYAKAGLTEEIVNQVVNGIKAYLTEQGIDVSGITIKLQSYTQSKVADLATAINTDGNVEIMLGMKAPDSSLSFVKDITGITMGTESDRRVHLLNDDSILARLVFEWFKTAEAQALFVTAE